MFRPRSVCYFLLLCTIWAERPVKSTDIVDKKQISRVLKQEGGDLEAVKKKFSSSKFGSVASMKVNVLPDDLP